MGMRKEKLNRRERFGRWRADGIDTKVRVAYHDWYDNYSLRTEKNEVLYLDSSDITNIVTPDFPETTKSKGRYRTYNWITEYASGIGNDKAFRAELRKGQGNAEGKYLAMLWRSTGDPNGCRVEYRTNYNRFSLDNRTANKDR